MKLNKNLTLIIPVVSLLLLLFIISGSGNDVIAQQPGPYHINHWTYGASAGSVSNGAAYTVHGTLGQQSVYASSGMSNSVSGGIWWGNGALSYVRAPEILVLEKEYRDDDYPVAVGDELLFIIGVTNNGDEPQTNVAVTDTVPSGLTLVAGSAEVDSEKGVIEVYSNTITLSADQLNYEQIAMMTYRVTVDPGMEGQSITNTVVARSDAYGPITDTATIHVFRPNIVFLPIVTNNYSEVPPPPRVNELEDAPDVPPGRRAEIDTDIYSDNFNDENDNDWFLVDLEEGETYTIQTSDLEEECDTHLSIYGRDGEVKLVENDDIDWPENVASRVVWEAPATGTFQVLVRHYDWTIYGDDTGYTLGVTHGDETVGMSLAPASESNIRPKPPAPPTPTGRE
jgi:uncharacterized repeat protein (TIGR01451 family)